MEDFLTYLGAYFFNLYTYSLGGLFAVEKAIVRWWGERPSLLDMSATTRRRLEVAALALGVFLVGFWLWQDEHQKWKAEQEKVAALTDRGAIVGGLQRLYVDSEPVFGALKSGELSPDQLRAVVALSAHWLNESTIWIESNLGPAARVRFLDLSQVSRNIHPFSPEQNDALERVRGYRLNMQALMQSNAWDRPKVS